MRHDQSVFTSILLFVGGMVTVFAGTPPSMAQNQQARGLTIEEVIVTARKRAESQQNVPIAVSAYDENFIEQSFTAELQEFDKYAPNVELGRMQFGGGAMTASIRGVSFGDLERTFEPAVGVSIDGVFLGTNTGAMIDIIDLESIEILRGPQGTLFGRNTMGGTINIRRTRPTGEFGGKLAVTAGSYNKRDVKAIFNAPLVKDILALKIGLFSLNGDSHTKNIASGSRDGGIDKQAATMSLLWTAGDSFEAQLTLDYMDDDSEYPGIVNLSGPGNLVCDAGLGCANTSFDLARASGFDLSFSSQPFLATAETTTAILQMTWDSDDYTVTSITSYNDVEDDLTAEVTGLQDVAPGVPGIFVSRQQTYNQHSQEFNVISNFAGPFNFVTGLYYFHAEYRMNPQTALFAGTLAARVFAGQKLDAYALFAETYFDIGDATRLTLGGRFTVEEKEFSIRTLQFSCPQATSSSAVCRNPREDWSEFTPRIGIDHRFNDDVMAYFLYSSGFRSGGFSGRAARFEAIGPYEPETLDNFEMGVKSDIVDGKLRINAALFRMKYENKQEEVLTTFELSTSTAVQNAASATIDGLELEVQALLTDAFMLRFSGGYLDSGYDKFEAGGVDLRANKNYRYAPETTLSLGGDYSFRIPVLSGDFLFGFNAKYTDEFTTSPERDPLGLGRDIIDDYTTFDASLSYTGHFGNDKTFSASLFVNDAFNGEGRLFRTLNAGAYWFGDQEPGRIWGLELRTSF